MSWSCYLSCELVEDGVPARLVRLCHVIIGKAGMPKRHESACSFFLENHRHQRFLSQCMGRHPRMLDPARSFQFDEPPIMRGALASMRRREQIPEPVDLRIEDQLGMLMPERAWYPRIEPGVENLIRACRDHPFNLDFHR